MQAQLTSRPITDVQDLYVAFRAGNEVVSEIVKQVTNLNESNLSTDK